MWIAYPQVSQEKGLPSESGPLGFQLHLTRKTFMRLAYMVPEFPGQTHTFFWREIAELEKLGIEVQITSTRRPKTKVHTWSDDAEQRTFYLHPLNPALLRDLGSAPILRLLQIFKMVVSASDVSLRERFKLACLVPYAIKLAAKAKREGWDHIHSHFCFYGADIALFASILSGIPYSISKHGPNWGVGNQFNKFKYARFATVITQRMLAEVNHDLAGYLPAKVIVCSMGVDTNVFRRSKPYVPWTAEEPFKIASCGRITPDKGWEFLLEAVANLIDKGYPIKLEIAGTGGKIFADYQASLVDICRVRDIETSVSFLGSLPESAVISLLDKAHCFALASPEEPLGVVYMEAMAMALPTIGTDAGGVPELIEHKTTGLLVKPCDSRSIEEAILWIMAHPESSLTMGVRARQWIEQHYQSQFGAKKLAQALGLDIPIFEPAANLVDMCGRHPSKRHQNN
jgi:glycosyltransferase involved in cell wall biosynthesis